MNFAGEKFNLTPQELLKIIAGGEGGNGADGGRGIVIMRLTL